MENTTKHRGRPKGATSVIEITLADLLAKVSDPTATVAVGRTWFNKLQVQPARHNQDGDSLPSEIRDQLEEETSDIEFSIS